MQQTKRPLLKMGLILTTILALCYIISQIFNLTSWIILVLFVAVFFFNMAALKTVNMSKSEFKKGKWYSWASIILVFIYNIFEFARILNDKNNIGVMDSTMFLMIGVMFISLFSILLCIFGILTRVIDNKITYEEHLKNTKNN